MPKDPYNNYTQAYDGQPTAIDTLNQADSYLSRLASWEKTMITGLQLEWVSTSSIKVKKGAAYVPSVGENSNNLVVVSADITIAGIAPGNNKWCGIYLYDNAGAAAAEAIDDATAVPTNYFGTAHRKGSDDTRRYLGSVRTNGSGQVINFQHNPITGFMRYRVNAFGAPFQLLSAGTATSETSVSASAVAPVTARQLLVYQQNTTPGSNGYFGTSEDSVTVPGGGGLSVAEPGTRGEIILALNATQAFTYALASAAGSGGQYITALGYWFER